MEIDTEKEKLERDYWRASVCCGAPLIEEQNMCSSCKEYALSRSAAADMRVVKAEYDATKEQREREKYQEECPHDENDHGICLDCGKDIFDDLVGQAEFYRDSLDDR